MGRPSLNAPAPGTRQLSDRQKRLRGSVLAPIWGAFMIAGLAGAVYYAREYLAFHSAPRRSTLETARVGEWVELEARLHCMTERTYKKNTYILGYSAGQPFVAVYAGKVACLSDPQPTGVVHELHPGRAAALREAGLDVPDGPVVELCTYCGPRNSALGILMMLFFAFVGAFFTRLALTMRRSGQRPRPSSSDR